MFTSIPALEGTVNLLIWVHDGYSAISERDARPRGRPNISQSAGRMTNRRNLSAMIKNRESVRAEPTTDGCVSFETESPSASHGCFRFRSNTTLGLYETRPIPKRAAPHSAP